MNNIYLLYGLDNSLIDNKVKKIINDYSDFDIIKYDMNINSIDELINEISMPSLFSKNKLLLINNSFFFNSNKSVETDDLEKCLNQLDKNIIIIFIDICEKIDNRKRITKLIDKIGKIIEIKKGDRTFIFSYLSDYIKENDFKCDDYTINSLIDNVGDNLNILINELDKLFMYKNESKLITYSDIEKLTIKNIEDDIFKLTDYIIKKDKVNCFKLYNDFKKNNYEDTYLIGLLASQFRFLLSVKMLSNKGKNKDEITSILAVHPYRVKLALGNLYNYTLNDLIRIIDELFKVDKNIKTGLVNKNVAIELFLANL